MYGCTSQKLLRVWYVSPHHPAEPWAGFIFFYLSGSAHCPLVWIMLLFVYGGLVFFSFIYILSLSRRIQTIRRLRGWHLCLKLCCVHAAFLDSASFLKYNPCHFFNTILVSRGFYCPAWWLAGLCLEGARVCSHFSPRRAPALGTVVTAGISEGTHFNVLFNVFASSLLSLLLPNSWKILFIYFISEASSVSCWSNGNFERQKYVSVSALSRGFDLRGRFSLNVKWKLHKLGSFYYNSKLPS